MSLQDDEQCMTRAIQLAARGRGQVEPNPLVGCVIARHGEIIAEGWHARFGGDHAEIVALGAAQVSVARATLYVNLEPCCHHGKTPPCTDAIIAAGIKRVVAAMSDPFPSVQGGGIAALRAAGIQVDVGLLEPIARSLNAPFLKRVTQQLPWVVAKWAMSGDGKLAAQDGSSRWISSSASREWVHTLRGRMDAIAVGIGTAMRDDPLLTARPPGPRVPLRVVYDRHARLPLHGQLVQTAQQFPTLVFTTSAAPESARHALAQHGCQVREVSGTTAVEQVIDSLRQLHSLNVTHLLLEGGAALQGAFWDARAMDEVHIFLAPLLVGGKDAVSPIGGRGLPTMPAAIRLQDPVTRVLDGDIHLSGRVLWDVPETRLSSNLPSP